MITPKEKANELINKFWLKIPTRYTPINEAIEQRGNKTDDMSIAKQCALIAVDEIIELLPEIAFGSRVILYWKQVKQSIKL